MTKSLCCRRLAPHLLMLPFVLTIAAFWIIPTAQSGVTSFQRVVEGQDLIGLAALLLLTVWRWTGVNTMYTLAGLSNHSRSEITGFSIAAARAVLTGEVHRITSPDQRIVDVQVTAL